MQSLDIGYMSFLLLGAVAAFAAIYYSFGMFREWLGPWTRATNGPIRKTVAHDASLDGHIATQWTEGRLRLDFLLAMIKQLEASLEQNVETLGRLDHADPLYEREARKMVEPSLRRFTFDQHLRDECRMLIPSLQFCAQDLAKSQGLDMTRKLNVLDEIQTTINSVDRS
ncbi:MAG TPA: hypothetical protein VK901_08965 [Nitrospiraceae bacterium]|nr:hypothetical protein [Nitrospiraceae bacterium]